VERVLPPLPLLTFFVFDAASAAAREDDVITAYFTEEL